MSALRKVVLSTGEAGLGDRLDEKLAGGAITPGHLVMRNSADAVVVHATSGGETSPLFAKEDVYQGRTIDDAYASGEPVQLHHAGSGDVINCILATSQTIVIGDDIMSNGNGQVAKKTSTNWIIGKAIEAVTTTGTAARLAIRIK